MAMLNNQMVISLYFRSMVTTGNPPNSAPTATDGHTAGSTLQYAVVPLHESGASSDWRGGTQRKHGFFMDYIWISHIPLMMMNHG